MKGKIFSILLSIFILSACQKRYYSENDFNSLLKIDSHVHVNDGKGLFEEQALRDNFVLININVDTADSSALKQQLENAITSTRKFGKTIFYVASFHFDTAHWGTPEWSRRTIEQLDNNIAGGAVSVKLWKNIGMTVKDQNGKFIMVDDPGLKPVIDHIISKNLPVTGHLGEPRNCWLPLKEMTVKGDSSYYAENPQYHMFLHPDYPSYEDQINARDHLLELHTELRFIGCHLGSLEYDVDELARRLDKFPNMAVDLAARICHLQYQSARDREKVRNFCIRYQDRLLYGTDLSSEPKSESVGLDKWIHDTWSEDWKYFATDKVMTSNNFRGSFKGLQLPKDVVRKIFRENAIKWYHLEGKLQDKF